MAIRSSMSNVIKSSSQVGNSPFLREP
jgi:hypothetical protein